MAEIKCTKNGSLKERPSAYGSAPHRDWKIYFKCSSQDPAIGKMVYGCEKLMKKEFNVDLGRVDLKTGKTKRKVGRTNVRDDEGLELDERED